MSHKNRPAYQRALSREQQTIYSTPNSPMLGDLWVGRGATSRLCYVMRGRSVVAECQTEEEAMQRLEEVVRA